jgi:hypothetical protein
MSTLRRTRSALLQAESISVSSSWLMHSRHREEPSLKRKLQAGQRKHGSHTAQFLTLASSSISLSASSQGHWHMQHSGLAGLCRSTSWTQAGWAMQVNCIVTDTLISSVSQSTWAGPQMKVTQEGGIRRCPLTVLAKLSASREGLMRQSTLKVLVKPYTNSSGGWPLIRLRQTTVPSSKNANSGGSFKDVGPSLPYSLNDPPGPAMTGGGPHTWQQFLTKQQPGPTPLPHMTQMILLPGLLRHPHAH